ncbi:hypothetical protein SPHINGOT1_80139 [Sphingomonas sp. T1]|nr:hypothetical protein SPHINGOT1_80139 [Sphingomonas sp. T1]
MPAGNIVTIASAPSAASAADATGRQPAAFALASASALRSNARTSWPFFARLAAIPPPMLPSPMNPMRAMFSLQNLPRRLCRSRSNSVIRGAYVPDAPNPVILTKVRIQNQKRHRP